MLAPPWSPQTVYIHAYGFLHLSAWGCSLAQVGAQPLYRQARNAGGFTAQEWPSINTRWDLEGKYPSCFTRQGLNTHLPEGPQWLSSVATSPTGASPPKQSICTQILVSDFGGNPNLAICKHEFCTQTVRKQSPFYIANISWSLWVGINEGCLQREKSLRTWAIWKNENFFLNWGNNGSRKIQMVQLLWKTIRQFLKTLARELYKHTLVH